MLHVRFTHGARLRAKVSLGRCSDFIIQLSKENLSELSAYDAC